MVHVNCSAKVRRPAYIASYIVYPARPSLTLFWRVRGDLAWYQASYRCKYKGGVAGPAGLALAGPLFSGSLVSCPDCRDGLRTRRLGQVSHAPSSPLPCVYAFLVIVPALLPTDQEPSTARPDCIGTHVLQNTLGYTMCSC